MWQLDTAAINASSGSTFAPLEYGGGTMDGDDDAGTVSPPSKLHVCSREYLPLRKSGPVHFQRMMAVCADMVRELMFAGRHSGLCSTDRRILRRSQSNAVS